MNEAIIAVPIVLVLIASSLYCYYKREGRRIDDRKIGDTATAIQSKKGEGKNLDSSV